jgi:DNA modification methylase
MAIIDKKITDKYALYNGDCIEVMQGMKEESIDMAVYSPPFADLYVFSSDVRDISNSDSYESFLEHYGYAVKELNRITKKGRFNCVHCCDIPKNNGASMIDLTGDIIRLHQKNGFDYVARHMIWKEPLWVRNKTMLRSLTHRTTVDNCEKAGVAGGDYLLVFRKRGECKVSITHENGFEHYAGLSEMPDDVKGFRGWSGDQKLNRFSHWIWQRYASCVWDDIDMGRLLPFIDTKEDDDEKHVTPTQMDVIDRAISMRSNIGDVVFTPFLGAGTEAYCAVKLDRKAVGVELKESYYRQACANMEISESDIQGDRMQTSLDFGFSMD